MNGGLIARGDAPELVMLTGALGSGKTSLISEYLALPDTVDTGVIVNDAGEINVDGAIVESGQRDLAVARLSNGCICCSIGNDLKEAVDELLFAREQSGGSKLRRIILETSGLALPGPIIRSIRNIDCVDFQLRIVSTCDSVSPAASDSVLPQYAAQIAAAQAVVLTKVDLASAEEIEAAREFVSGINPLAGQISDCSRKENARAAFNDVAPRAGRVADELEARQSAPHPRVTILMAHWEAPVAWETMLDWLEDVAGFCGDRLLRIKGLVTPFGSDQSIIINGVGEAFGAPRIIERDISREIEGLTIILRDMEMEEFRRFSEEVSLKPPSLKVSPF